jgi:hypothetical protein
LAEHIPADFRLSATLAKAIALYVERRARIPLGRRAELANYIAMPLFRKFGFREDTSSDLLLCAIYYREFVAREAFSSEITQPKQAKLLANSPLDSINHPNQLRQFEQIDAPPVLVASPPTQPSA